MDGRSSKRAAKTIEIHLFSDSTGDTAARVARAAQTQFSGHPTVLVRHPRVTTLDGLEAAYGRLSGRSHVAVLFTIVDRELRRTLSEMCERDSIACCDLLGPPLEALGQAAGHEADLVSGRPIALDADYFRRVAAMEFVVKHDDGLAGEGLAEAEIVLVGVSRTGKTPLSMYLGYLGYKTANVPLVRGIEPPAHLFAIEAAPGGRADDRRRAPGAHPRPASARARGSLARRVCRARADHGGARRGDAPSTGGSAARCSTSRASPSRRPPQRVVELVDARRSHMTAGYVPGR